MTLFEADFGQRTPAAILERHLAETTDREAAALAREIVEAVVAHRVEIDRSIEELAPRYPVVQLARIDRTLLRCAIGEVLHSRTTPARVAIAEWVELARIYSGDPARRLINGVLGRIASRVDARPARTGTEAAEESPGG